MFRWDDCLEGHVLIGLILSMAAFILLLLTSLATPTIKAVYFLSAPNGIKYGPFGYCLDGGDCTSSSVGYDTGPEIINWLTKTHVLFPIATAFMGLAIIALILSLMRVGKFMWKPVYFRTTALLATFAGFFAELFALILWVTARHRFNANGTGERAQYGAALWLGLAGVALAFFAACIGGPAFAGNYGMHWANRNVAYNV